MLRQLQASSNTALRQYARTISRTSELLNDPALALPSSDERSKLLEHFRKETRAYDKYMRARRKLWSALITTSLSSLGD